MLGRPEKEENFIEQRRLWQPSIDKPFGKGTMLMILPAITLCFFVVVAAPYIAKMLEMMIEGGGQEIGLARLNIEDPVEVKPVEPPPNPEHFILQRYRETLEAEGIDWKEPPEVEMPELIPIVEHEVEIKPLDVDLSPEYSRLVERE